MYIKKTCKIKCIDTKINKYRQHFNFRSNLQKKIPNVGTSIGILHRNNLINTNRFFLSCLLPLK